MVKFSVYLNRHVFVIDSFLFVLSGMDTLSEETNLPTLFAYCLKKGSTLKRVYHFSERAGVQTGSHKSYLSYMHTKFNIGPLSVSRSLCLLSMP